MCKDCFGEGAPDSLSENVSYHVYLQIRFEYPSQISTSRIVRCSMLDFGKII